MSLSSPSYKFIPSNVFRFVGSIVDFPRKEYSTNITEFVGSDIDSDAHRSYLAGLIFLSCVFGGILLIWCFFLVWLKLNATAVGCAAGRPFEPDVQARDNHKLNKRQNKSKKTKRKFKRLNSDILSVESSIPSSNDSATHPHGETFTTDESSVEADSSKPSVRERRTQTAFFTFGLCTIFCAPLIIVFSFKPLSQTRHQSDEYLSDTRNIISVIKTSIDVVNNASESSLSLIPYTSSLMNPVKICPKSNETTIMLELGIDITKMLSVFNLSRHQLLSQLAENITGIKELVSYTEDAINAAESTFDTVDDYSWTVPTFLLILCTAVSLSLIGVFLARRRSSSRRLQWYLSYTILPLLVISSLFGWMISIVLAVVSAIGSDVCLKGAQNETILELFEQNGHARDDIIFQSVSEYIGGCHSDGDPIINSMMTIKNDIVDATSYIRQFLSTVDSIGQTNIDDFCGKNHSLDRLRIMGQYQVNYLTEIDEALNSTLTSVSCDRLNQLYLKTFSTVCTDAVDAAAWGFIFFLLIGSCTMTIVSLRASWYHQIKEDKIYDESEVAVNMIVDEHEEYLRYISKYKHEWEEYQGLDVELADPNQIERIQPPIQAGSTGSLYNSDSDDVPTGRKNDVDSTKHDPPVQVYSESSQTNSEAIECVSCQTADESTQEPFDPYSIMDSQSQASTASEGSISFLSLNDLELQGRRETQPTRQFNSALPPLLSSHHILDDNLDEEDIFLRPYSYVFPAETGESSINMKEVSLRSMSRPQTDSHSRRIGRMPPLSPKTIAKTVTQSNRGSTDQCIAHLNQESMSLFVRQISREMDEIGGHIAGKGTPVSSSKSSVQFQVEDDSPTSFVQQQAARISKTGKSRKRSSTPPRRQPTIMKELASKYDSPLRDQAGGPRRFSFSSQSEGDEAGVGSRPDRCNS